jgi:hypothetical protein
MAGDRRCETCEHFHGRASGWCKAARTQTTPYNWCHIWSAAPKPQIGVPRPERKPSGRSDKAT